MYHPASFPRTSATVTAFCIATIGELVALGLFLVMFGIWAGIASGRI